MVLIDHPQQDDVPQDDSPSPQPRARHAAPADDAGTRRWHRRRRWPILAAVAALGVLVVPPPGPHQRTVVAEVADDSALPMGLSSAATISFLSAGAPDGVDRAGQRAGAGRRLGAHRPDGDQRAGRQRHPERRAQRLPRRRGPDGQRRAGLRHRLVAARRHRPRRVQPRPLRRRHAQLRRHVVAADHGPAAERRAVRLHPRHRRRQLRRRQLLRPRRRPDAVHPGDLAARTASTPTARARPTRSTSTTPRSARPTTSASPAATCAPTPASATPSWPTTTPTAT